MNSAATDTRSTAMTPGAHTPSAHAPSDGLAARLRRWRYRWSFKIFLSDLLSKTWMEPAIPFVIMVALINSLFASLRRLLLLI